MADSIGTPVFWSISQEAILDMLRQVAAGADPDLVYAEAYANAEIDHVDGDASDG